MAANPNSPTSDEAAAALRRKEDELGQLRSEFTGNVPIPIRAVDKKTIVGLINCFEHRVHAHVSTRL